MINELGDTAFLATITGVPDGHSAVIRQNDSITTEIVRSETTSPDGNGVFFDFGLDRHLAINDSGEVALRASFELGSTPNGFDDAFVMFRGDGTTNNIIARSGDPTPDGNGVIKGEAFGRGFGLPQINAFGEVAFRVNYANTTQGPLDDDGILKGNVKPGGSQVVEVVREGWSLPGGGEFATFLEVIDMNPAGVVAWESMARNVPGIPSNPTGIFLGDGIDIVQVALPGDLLADNYTILNVSSSGTYGMATGGLNRHGQVALSARLRRGTQLPEAALIFTPALYWRGGTSGSWDSRLASLGETNLDASQNWSLSLTPASVHSVIVDRTRATTRGGSVAAVQVTGPAADATISDLELREGTSLELTGSHLTVSGGVTLAEGRLHGGGQLSGPVEIQMGGRLEPNGLTVHHDVVNDGETIIDNGAANPSTNTFNGNFHNDGALVVGANQTAEFVGDYLGAGTIDNDGEIIYHGLMPGSSPANVEMLGNGTITLAPGSKTVMELGGTQRGSIHGDPLAEYDSLTLSEGGSLALDGNLSIELVSPDGVAPIFVPALGDTFSLFEVDQLMGAFDAPIQLPALSGGLSWNVTQSANSFTLDVVAAPDVDLDDDGDVDGQDFLLIQRTNPLLVSAWENQYGNDVVPFVGPSVVPEPLTLLLLLEFAAIYRVAIRSRS